MLTEVAAPAVSARGLIKSYGDRVAVAGIDFEVEPGICFGFLEHRHAYSLRLRPVSRRKTSSRVARRTSADSVGKASWSSSSSTFSALSA